MTIETPVARRVARRWRDLVHAADPGGFSLRAAVRAILSLVAAGALLTGAGAPLSGALLGGTMAMTMSVAVFEPTPAAEVATVALAVAAAIATVSASTVLAGSPLASGALLVAVVFLAVIARAKGARGMAVGMLAFMGCFFALFVGARPAQLPMLAACLAAGGAAALLVRNLIVRERPARVHASVLRAFRARLSLLLDDLARELETGALRERRLRRIRRETGKVNEIALALEAAVGRTESDPPPPEVRPWLVQLVEVEVAVDMLTEAVHRIAGREWDEARRLPLAATLRALRRWIDDGGDAARAEVLRLLAEVESDDEAARGAAAERDAEVLARRALVYARVRRAVALLTGARPWTALPAQAAARARVTQMAFRPGGGGTAGMRGLWPTLRIAVQATVAVALAIVAGRAISAERWYWAGLAAFVVFIRASTFGETLSRAWQRFLGTLLGVAAGLAIAEPLREHTMVAGAVALVAMFVAYALLRVSYTGMILFITIALALLYETMGRPVPGLMGLRLEETAVGAGIAVLVAALLFPLHSAGRVRRLVADLLREAALVIARVTTPGADPRLDDALHEDVRRVDRALAEVRNALRPLWAPQLPLESARLSRQGRTAAALAYATRRVLTEPPAAGVDAELLRRVGERLARNCRAVADGLESGRAPVLAPVAPLIVELARPDGGAPEASPLAVLCADVDALVRRLASESGLGDGAAARAA